MKKILYLIIVALLTVTAGTAWGQTNRTLGDIPTGWKVQAGSVNFTADENNYEVQIPAGSTVTLTPMYPAKVKSVKLKDISEIPLTFEAKVDGFSVKLTSGLTTKPSLQYSIDGGNWTDLTFDENIATISSIDSGQKISFRAKTINNAFGNQYTYSGFSCSQECYIYGNIMSLLSKDDFATATSVPDYAFRALFQGNDKILSHPSKPLVLPATNLAKNCYAIMFYGCTSLTTAPDLPATTLADSCYEKMFNGCTNLVTAPAISATTLAKGCCCGMFGGCTSLTTGPTLHAATLVDDCYQRMFFGCTNLNSVTCLATNISASQCTYLWLGGVATTGTFTAHDPTVLWSDGASGIPTGWTRVNKSNIVNLASLGASYEAQNNDTLTGTLGGNYKITIADRATVTLRNATINGTNNNSYQWAGITCLGDATIVLEGTNTVTGFHHYYPGIQAAHNGTGSGDEYTLTIKGDGSLTASSNDYYGDFCAAGIGAGYNHACGNILIESGTIVANGDNFGAGIGGAAYTSCGTITITGGTVTATGGQYGAGVGSGIDGECQSISITGGTVIATGGSGEVSLGGGGAGIGSGTKGSCSTITITDGVTQVTATKGANAPYSIGAGGGSSASCGTVTIGGTEYYNGTNYENEGATYLAQSPLVYPAPPTGAINGKFSVSSNKQVYFSQGNLQYTKSTGVWSFMEHQYSTVETTGSYCTNDYGNRDVVSLFGWATSGYNHGATCYQPYSTNTTNENYYAYGDASYNLYDQTGQADWGYNAISNGGNTVNSDWRTLTTVEWQYLFANHTTGWSSVNGVNGYVIRPDGVSTAIAASYTASDWDTEEAAGAVFLPAAGYRNSYVGTDVYDKGSIGRYWSSSADGSNANYVNFSNSSLGPNYTMNRKYGLSVRLVKNAN